MPASEVHWIVFGVNEDDSREEIIRFEYWKDVVKWMADDWGLTMFYGLLIMPDDGMYQLLKEERNG